MVYSLDTRDLPTLICGFGEYIPGLWPAGVIALPSPRHQPDGTHTAPGRSYGQGHEGVAMRRLALWTECLFTRALPAFQRPHLGLQRIPRSPRRVTGEFFRHSGPRPSRTRLQVAPPQLSFALEESSLFGEAFHLVEQTFYRNGQ